MEVDSLTPEEALSKETPEEALSMENLRKFHAMQVDSDPTMVTDDIKQLEENVKKFSSCPWRMTLHNQTAC